MYQNQYQKFNTKRYEYQSINANQQQPIRYENYQNSKAIKDNNEIKQTNQYAPYQSDNQYYNSLQFYRPICYFGQGVPLFFIHDCWYSSFACLIILDIIFILAFLLIGQQKQMVNPYTQREHQPTSPIYMLATITNLVLLNITYFLVQFINPGIQNPHTISQQQYQKHGKKFCSKCRAYCTIRMTHCSYCEVCIDDLDHHCGFFGKCIGGYQRIPFYLFLLLLFVSFILLIVMLVSTLD